MLKSSGGGYCKVPNVGAEASLLEDVGVLDSFAELLNVKADVDVFVGFSNVGAGVNVINTLA